MPVTLVFENLGLFSTAGVGHVSRQRLLRDLWLTECPFRRELSRFRRVRVKSLAFAREFF